MSGVWMAMALGAWLSGMEREVVRESGREGKDSQVDRGDGNEKRRTGLDWWTYGKRCVWERCHSVQSACTASKQPGTGVR